VGGDRDTRGVRGG